MQLSHLSDYLHLPSVPAEQNSLLGGVISNAEILEAIKSLKCNKTPRPDGYTSEFFQRFAPNLCPLLRAMFNEFLSFGHLPPILRQAAITLLPKGGKDPLHCSFYCLISLLNVDYKILFKVLAALLEKTVQQLIFSAQTAFILNRYSSSNIRLLFSPILRP